MWRDPDLGAPIMSPPPPSPPSGLVGVEGPSLARPSLTCDACGLTLILLLLLLSCLSIL